MNSSIILGLAMAAVNANTSETYVTPVRGAVRVLVEIQAVEELGKNPTIPGAELVIRFVGRSSATTDGDGRFCLEGGKVDPGETLTLALIKSTYRILRPDKGKITIPNDSGVEHTIIVATAEVINKQRRLIESLQNRIRSLERDLSVERTKKEGLTKELESLLSKLSRLGVPEAQQLLEQLITSKNSDVAQLARVALGEHVKQFPSMTSPIASIYKTAFDAANESDPKEKYSALISCIEACKDQSSEEKRAAAALLLWAYRKHGQRISNNNQTIHKQIPVLGIDAFPLLVAELQQREGTGQRNAYHALWDWGGTTESPIVSELKRVKSLGKEIGPGEAADKTEIVEALERVINTDNTSEDTRRLARECLKEIRDPTNYRFLSQGGRTKR